MADSAAAIAPPSSAPRSDVFLPLLHANDKSLRELVLSNTCITRPTIDMIGDALRGNKTLQTLDLSNNPDLTDEDLEYFITECLPENKGLMRLILSGNPLITAATIERLLDVIRLANDSLTVIEAAGTQIDALSARNFEDMAALNRFPSHFKQQVFRAIRNDPDLFKIELVYDKSDPKVLNEIGIATLARALSHPTTAEDEAAEKMRRPEPILRGDSDDIAAVSATNDDVETAPTAYASESAAARSPLDVTEIERITNENGNVKVRPTSVRDARLLQRERPLRNNTVRTLRLDNKCCRGERCVEALLPCVATNPYLAVIGLASNDLGDEAVRMLCGAIRKIGARCGIETLDLGYNEITDEGVKMLIACVAENTSLRSIILTGNKHPLSPHLLQQLQQGTALNCEPSAMKEAIARIKEGYPKNMTREAEREVYIRQNAGEFTDERGILRLEGTDADAGRGPSKGYFTSLGAATIAAALPTNITIHTIRFQNNHIGPEGAKALADILEYNPTIARLDLRGNPVGDEGARRLIGALKNNDALVSLDVTEGCGVSQRLLDEIAALTHLNRQPEPIKKYVSMAYDTWGGGSTTDASPPTLDLRRRSVQVRGKWKSLQPESVQYILSILAAQPRIASLDLSDNDTLGDEGALMLAAGWLKDPRCRLRRLDLSNTGITSAAVDAITATMRSNYSLTSVVVAGNNEVLTRPRQALEEALALNALPPAVKDLVPLLKGDIDGIHTVSFIRQPDEFYSRKNRGGAGGAANASAVSQSQHQQQPPPPLGDDAARALFSTMMENTHVTSVTLRNQQLSNRGMQYASECLGVNTHITEIDLRDNMIGPDGIAAFAEVLERNTTLERVDLSGNPIGPDGAEVLLLAMQTANRSVRFIGLEGCRVLPATRRKIEALAAFNAQSLPFRNLVLDRIVSTRTVYYRGGIDNNERSKVAAGKQQHAVLPSPTTSDAADGAPQPTSEQVLSILPPASGRNNTTSGTNNMTAPDFLSDGAIDALLMALDSHEGQHRVRSIQLPNNHISDAGLRRLLFLLHKHPTIVDVDLSSNPLTDAVTRELTAFLVTHTHIKRFVVGNGVAASDDFSKALLFGTADNAAATSADPASRSGRSEGGKDANANSVALHDVTFATTASAASPPPPPLAVSSSGNNSGDGGAIARSVAVCGNSNVVDLAPDALKLLVPMGPTAHLTVAAMAMAGSRDHPSGVVGRGSASAAVGSAVSAARKSFATLHNTSVDGSTVAVAPGARLSTLGPVGAVGAEAAGETEAADAPTAASAAASASGAPNSSGGSGDEYVARCQMSDLSLKHVRVAVALSNSSPAFRRAYLSLSQQLLRWCDLRGQVGVGVGGGSAPLANGMYSYNNGTSTIGSRMGNLPHHEHYAPALLSAAAINASRSANANDDNNNTIYTNAASAHNTSASAPASASASARQQHLQRQRQQQLSERAQTADAAAPEVIQLSRCDMGAAETRLLMNLLVRPSEGIIVSQQQMLAYGMDAEGGGGGSGGSNGGGGNGKGGKGAGGAQAGAKEGAPSATAAPAAPSTAGRVSAANVPFATIPPSPAGPISSGVGAVPDGEVLRRHVRGLSFAGNIDFDDSAVEMVVSEYLIPSMRLYCGDVDGGGQQEQKQQSEAEAGNNGVVDADADSVQPLCLQALVLDGCGVDGRCLPALQRLAVASPALVVLGLEHTTLAEAMAAARAAAAAAEEERLSQMAAAAADEQQLKAAGAASPSSTPSPSSQSKRPSQSLSGPIPAAPTPSEEEDLLTLKRLGGPNKSLAAYAADDTDAALDAPSSQQQQQKQRESSVRTVLEIYGRMRDRIGAVLTANRSRMVGLASDELFAAHATAQRSALAGSSSRADGSSSSPLYGSGAAAVAAANVSAVGGASKKTNLLLASSSSTSGGAGGGGVVGVGTGGELVHAQTAASLGAAATTGGYAGRSADVSYFPAGGDHSEKAMPVEGGHSTTSPTDRSGANVSSATAAGSRLGSSLQYGRSLREAIPTTYEDHRAAEDAIFNDAIAGAPQRHLGHAEYIRNTYKGRGGNNGASSDVVLPRNFEGSRLEGEQSATSPAASGGAKGGKATLAVGQKYSTITSGPQ